VRDSSSRTAALIVASAALGAACIVQPGEDVGASAAAIIGGTADTGDTAVVAVVQKSNQTLCSGTLISPTLVLTAAHCVYGLSASELQVIVGDAIASPDQTLDVASVVAYPTYDGESDGIPGGVDLGVVTLAQPVSLPAIAVDTTTTDAELSGAKVTVVGYGLASASDNGTAGVRREVTLTVDSVCSRLITAGDDQANACQGDSGGAVLLGGKLVAVVSAGSSDCTGPTSFTRTDAHAAWVAAVLAGDAAAACSSCVPPDVLCGAATETRPASTSTDAGGEDAGPTTDAAATPRDASASKDAGAAPRSGGGCAASPMTGASSPRGVPVWMALVVATAWRRRRRWTALAGAEKQTKARAFCELPRRLGAILAQSSGVDQAMVPRGP
jgi:MYXO-CTERM domain-containing protein